MKWHDEAVMIPGYEDLPLVDGVHLLGDARFWPTYLSASMASGDDSLVTAAFEVDQADCWDYFRRLTDPEAWPVFRLGLRDGHEIDIVYRNVPGAGGTEFVMCRPGGEYKVDLANVGGHEFLPGLSWPELIAAASWSTASYGVIEPDARLLLLLPAFGDADLPAGAAAKVAAALKKCGAGAGAGELAEWLLEEPEDWPHWRREGDGALVCGGRYSRRNPEGPAGHTRADLLEITSALAAG
ncbi:hypothetical protein [Micromonospora sp. NPDC049497]|uniref:hypothetical protein n=1 Tax=Micromonospora sp. NPDC049497 TaxID=3364273 RepID=UPI0037AAAF46